MHLVPKVINPNTKSHAEKVIFEELKNCSLDGIAIHSLELSKHVTKLYSEIDFVVITKRGVLCLEVKGGEVTNRNGKWQYIDRYGNQTTNNKSPFKQARTGKESLLAYVKNEYKKKNGNEIRNCVYGYGVLFPDTYFHGQGSDIDPSIIYDRSNENISDYILSLYDLWEPLITKRLGLDLQGRKMPHLNNVNINLLKDFLIGKTKSNKEHFTNKDFLDVDNNLKQLSEEQYKIFQYGIQNERQLVEGGAGTGKTIIAIKYAIEKANQGKSVLLLCFNRMLAKEISNKIKHQCNENINIRVSNFHNYLIEQTGLNEDEVNNLDEFYKITLPEIFLSQGSYYETFDTLILDEGQDLLMENYLICIDQFVNGGLSDGNWIMLYDKNQNIYLKEKFNKGLNEIQSYNPYLGQLRENYRNTRQIDEANKALTNIQSAAVSRSDGDEVEIFEYSDNAEAQKQLKGIVKSLIKKGVSCKDIVILSPHRLEHSVIEGKRNLFEESHQSSPCREITVE